MPRMPRLAPLLLLLLPSAGAAQELVHHAQGIERQLSQTVKLTDPWRGRDGDALFQAKPRDIETRIFTKSSRAELVEVELLMHGPWGWYHFSYPETEILRDEPEATGRRTLHFTLDIDGDGENELLLLERSVKSRMPLDENGDRVGDARPHYFEHQVTLRYLDRKGEALVENLVAGDPDDPGFAAVLARELGGPANAALQLLAGDYLFNQERYADARYRYQVAREWAERSLPGGRLDDLSADMTLLQPDPDHAEFTWITAMLRHGALPPYYRRRY